MPKGRNETDGEVPDWDDVVLGPLAQPPEAVHPGLPDLRTQINSKDVDSPVFHTPLAHTENAKPHDSHGSPAAVHKARNGAAPPPPPGGSSRGSGDEGDGGTPRSGDDDGGPPSGVPAVPAEHRTVTARTEAQVFEPEAFVLSLLNRLKSWWTPPEFASNKITTYKYTIITFLPVNLFQQFMRVANLYFLLVTILQVIPGLSPTSWFTTVFALIIVLAINAVKEGYDDYKRHKSDGEINARKVAVLVGDGEVETAWQDIVVGDLVKVVQDTEFPSDLLFLSSSDTEHICYVETANLDGETNLKNKSALPATAGLTTAHQMAPWANSHALHCELPNPRLYVFEGAVVDRSDQPDFVGGPDTAVGPDQLLLRGCTLRSVAWIIGVAVFTGADSKIMMNRTPAKRKVTQLELHMNVAVALLFTLLVGMSCLLAMGSQIWLKDHAGDWYLEYQNKWPDEGPSIFGWFIQVLRFIILLNGVIPISLYVTLEVVKVFQCGLILNQDRRMYHAPSDTPFACHTTTLNEDLGQVQYVMSDKTGTLTQNVMGFVWVSVAGVLYGQPRGENDPPAPEVIIPPSIPDDTPHYLTRDKGLHATLMGLQGQPDRQPVHEFFEHLAVCNTVVPAMREDGRIEYQASSPDEEALVEGAAAMDFRLCVRTSDRIEVDVAGDRQVYTLLAVLEFNSDRKRMSVICRTPEGKVKLFCKGADTMILARILEDDPIAAETKVHLDEMAQAGYRTLCVAVRELPEELYQTWAQHYAAASTALQDREDKLGAVAEKIEREMVLLGATAVEDKLQDGVPEAIESLINAGIHVWVLTGDKVETAISIALSCRLFKEDMLLVEMRPQDFEPDNTADDKAMHRFDGMSDTAWRDQVLQRKIDEVDSKNREVDKLRNCKGSNYVGLIIEGGALALCLPAAHHKQLMKLCDAAKTVVCCRVTPMQKALVTRLVRKQRQAIVLGIGDGANDVGMIQAAHIGVGIGGREGRAAVLASDFSFAQFKYLTRLLLWHGRSAYKQNTEVVWYAFYKNWLYNFTFVFFAFWTGYSAQPLFTTGMISTFNVAWTATPTVAFAVIEQDLSSETIALHPELYTETRTATRKSFFWRFTLWMLLGTWHSAVIYFIPLYTMSYPDRTGVYYDWAAVGFTTYTAAILVINYKIALRTHYWTWITHTLIWGVSIGIFFVFAYGYNVVWQIFQLTGTWDFSGTVVRAWSGPLYWLGGVLLAPVLALLPDFIIMTIQRERFPQDFQVYQELESLGYPTLTLEEIDRARRDVEGKGPPLLNVKRQRSHCGPGAAPGVQMTTTANAAAVGDAGPSSSRTAGDTEGAVKANPRFKFILQARNGLTTGAQAITSGAQAITLGLTTGTQRVTKGVSKGVQRIVGIIPGRGSPGRSPAAPPAEGLAGNVPSSSAGV